MSGKMSSFPDFPLTNHDMLRDNRYHSNIFSWNRTSFCLVTCIRICNHELFNYISLISINSCLMVMQFRGGEIFDQCKGLVLIQQHIKKYGWWFLEVMFVWKAINGYGVRYADHPSPHTDIVNREYPPPDLGGAWYLQPHFLRGNICRRHIRSWPKRFS